jgi:Rod binding domain-containing protein
MNHSLSSVSHGISSASSSGADPQAKAGLATAARQFEAIFTKQLLEAMGKTSPEGGSKGASAGLYDDMMNQAVAQHMSSGRGAGIGALLYRQWTGEEMPTVTAGAAIPRTSRAPDTLPSFQSIGARSIDGPAGSGPDVLDRPRAVVPAVSAFVGSRIESEPASSGSGRLVDDGTTPLRDMLPPTGLEDYSAIERELGRENNLKKVLNHHSEAPEAYGVPTSAHPVGTGESNGYQASDHPTESGDVTSAGITSTGFTSSPGHAASRRAAKLYQAGGTIR